MNLITLPVLLPLFSGAVLLMLPNRWLRNSFAALASTATLVISVLILRATLGGHVLVVQMANWPAPWGITLATDLLSSIMLTVSSLVGLLAVLFASSSLNHSPRMGKSSRVNIIREQLSFQALFQFLFMGVNMSFLTGDLFNLFVAFEVMLIASYGLLLVGNELPQLREGFKYIIINLISSAIFVVAAGLAYGLFGTLNMADIAVRVAEHGPDQRITTVAALLAIVFATKAAVFPLGFWLPNTYPTPAAPVSAFFAAVLTKVGAYALIRTFTLMFPVETAIHTTILLLTAATVLIGGFGAIARQRWRHTLSFANVSSIGYLVMGVFVGTTAGLSAAIYYTVHSVIVIFSLFLIAALGEFIAGEAYQDSGHLRIYPWLGVAYFICALALAGIPPTSGFIAKYAVIAALFASGGQLQIWIASAAVVTGFLLLYAVIRIWRGFFWGESDSVHHVRVPLGMRLVTATAVAVVITLAISSGPVYRAATIAAAQLSGNYTYIHAVLLENGTASEATPAAEPHEGHD